MSSITQCCRGDQNIMNRYHGYEITLTMVNWFEVKLVLIKKIVKGFRTVYLVLCTHTKIRIDTTY